MLMTVSVLVSAETMDSEIAHLEVSTALQRSTEVSEEYYRAALARIAEAQRPKTDTAESEQDRP